MKKGIRVTVEDLEADTKDVVEIENDYLLLAVGTCYVDGFQTYTNGTHVVTIKRPGGDGTTRKIESS
jgi:hypothetical protein